MMHSERESNAIQIQITQIQCHESDAGSSPVSSSTSIASGEVGLLGSKKPSVVGASFLRRVLRLVDVFVAAVGEGIGATNPSDCRFANMSRAMSAAVSFTSLLSS